MRSEQHGYDRKNKIKYPTSLHQSMSSPTMNIANRHNTFVNSTAGDFLHNVPSRRTSRTNSTGRQQDGESASADQPRNRGTNNEQADIADLRTLKRVLDVLKEGGMDVAGFLDALCWGNPLAIVDPIVKSARTRLTHSEKLATVVSRWLRPARTSQGGSTAAGAREILLPLVIRTVKEIINSEMVAVVEELKEDSADITEQSVLGTVIDEVQEKVRVTAPVFYDLVRTAAWSKVQEERNTLKDPTKVSVLHEFRP